MNYLYNLELEIVLNATMKKMILREELYVHVIDHRINDFRIGGLFVMPEIDFLNKKTFTKTSGMINLRKRATIESP